MTLGRSRDVVFRCTQITRVRECVRALVRVFLLVIVVTQCFNPEAYVTLIVLVWVVYSIMYSFVVS